MAETAINVVLSKFGELATREVAVLLQVGGDIMQLRDQLEWLQAFIRDADRKGRAGTVDGLTLVWVRQTRNAAFDAEDALDEFFHKGYLQSRGDGIWIRYLTSWWSEITVRHWLSRQIKSISRTLDDTARNRKEYNIEHTPSRIWTSSATSLSPRDVPEIEEADYIKDYGLWYLLVDPCPEKMLISVVGESGYGKNTLVDVVYKKIHEEFNDFVIWYNLPSDSSTQDVLKQVFKRVHNLVQRKNLPDPTGESECTDIDIAAKLRGLLDGKKYLVVLSGISSKTLLNCVWASLPDNKKGSRVVLILDSVHYDVARHGADTLNEKKKDGTILWLGRWDEERSASLFQARVKVPGGEVSSCKEDEHYVHAMTEGHPLAIAILAGLLRHKDPMEREAMLKQLNRRPANANDEKANRMPAIERILSACYDDLPQDLKSCFLYFAAYPKNIPLPAQDIVRMWMAEGFIRRRKGKTPEELGHMYLDELVSRCLVKRIRRTDMVSPEMVLVHSRVLEFLQSEARQASFIEVHDRCDVLEPAAVRRLSIQDDGNGYALSSTSCFPKLRSFICRVDKEEEEEVQRGGGSIVVPPPPSAGGPLPGEEGGGGGRPEHGQIGRTSSTWCWWSSMLSCLGLGAAAGRHDISFLCRSKFLRVLSVQGLSIEELPEEMGDMIHLRYIRVNCRGLKELPSSIWKLLNLETLDITTTQVEEIDQKFWGIKALRHVLAEKLTLPPASSVPKELGDLQTLHGVKPTHDQDNNWEDCPLHKMTKLRSLELHGLKSSIHGLVLADALRKMHLLGHLKLQGDVIPSCVFTAPSLRCLQTMVLQADTKVEWDHIPEDFNVHHVWPNLLQLKLKDISKVPKNIEQDLGTCRLRAL